MGFEDLEDFNDLNELPPFDDDMDDLPNMGGPESGEISRTFKILGALMFIVVLVVVILLVVVALSGGNEISDTDKQRTSIAQANATTQGNYYATLTAIAAAGQASQTAAFGIELTATVTMQARQTQEAGTATQAVIRQTADAASSATAAAQEEATQVAQETSVAATASANALTGQLLLPNQEPFANVPLMLYRDDGDGVFNAGQVTPAPSATEPLASGDNAPSNSNIGPISQTETAIVQKTQAVAPPAAATAPAGAQTLGYGESGQGTLAAGAVSSWTFTGAAGDAVTISAFPGEGSTIDIVLSLVGPDGATLIQDGASDAKSDATISNYSLVTAGQYTIQVGTLTGTGTYEITLNTGTPSTGYVLPVSGSGSIDFLPYHQAGAGTPTPEQGDILLGQTTTGPAGEFDFGQLEPGVYFLVVRYEDLPDELKAQITTPTDLVYIKVTVPTFGQTTFEITTPEVGGTPVTTAPRITPQASPLVTGTQPTGLLTVTPSPTEEVVGTIASPTALQNTGVLSDAANSLSDGNGTSGLTILVIAAVGLVAVVFVARKLRTS